MRKTLILPLAGLFAVSVLVSVASADSGAGKTYFKKIEEGNCKTCHYTNSRRLVGPGMEDVTKRHTEKWLRLWLSDPQGTWQSDHPETLELKKRTRKVRVRATSCVKKPMSEEQTGNLLDFLRTLEKN